MTITIDIPLASTVYETADILISELPRLGLKVSVVEGDAPTLKLQINDLEEQKPLDRMDV